MYLIPRGGFKFDFESARSRQSSRNRGDGTGLGWASGPREGPRQGGVLGRGTIERAEARAGIGFGPATGWGGA